VTPQLQQGDGVRASEASERGTPSGQGLGNQRGERGGWVDAISVMQAPMSWLAVALGGALGSMLRYGLSLGAAATGGPDWPFGTFAANVLGSFGLGVLFVAGEGHTVLGVDSRLLLGTGAMGGFTTYSTFNLELIRYAQEGMVVRAVAYGAATVVVCLGAALAGIALGRAVRA
jgi:fluoride exporter